MKVAIYQPNEILKNLVTYTRQFSDSVEFNSFDEVAKDRKTDVLFAPQGDMKSQDINELRDKFPQKKIMILAHTIEPFFEKSCVAHGVLLLSEEMSERERLNAIQKVWFGLEEQTEYRNVICVHGTHRQVGCTQTTLALGHTLGTFNYKTIVIGLNPHSPGEDTKRRSTYSLDQVYDLIQSNVIQNGETLLPYLEKYDHFYYLVGNRDFYKAPTFEQKAIEELITMAKDYFHVVLLDVGSFYDNFLPLTGLQMSNTHILISSQEHIAVEEYKRWEEQILGRFQFYPKTKYQIVNKYASKAIMTGPLLEDKLGIPVLTQIPFFPEANDAIIEDGILYFSEYKSYNKAIEGIARAIGDELIVSSNYEKGRPSLLGKVFGRMRAQ